MGPDGSNNGYPVPGIDSGHRLGVDGHSATYPADRTIQLGIFQADGSDLGLAYLSTCLARRFFAIPSACNR